MLFILKDDLIHIYIYIMYKYINIHIYRYYIYHISNWLEMTHYTEWSSPTDVRYTWAHDICYILMVTMHQRELTIYMNKNARALVKWLRSQRPMGFEPAPFIANLFLYHYKTRLTVCYYYVTYAYQSESTLYSCLNVKELFARNRCNIWSLSDSNGIGTHTHLVRKQTLNHLAKLKPDLRF